MSETTTSPTSADTRVAGKSIPAAPEQWSSLVGCYVEVRLAGVRVAGGRVEEASTDNDFIWIAADGTETRKLFDRPSGYRILVEGN